MERDFTAVYDTLRRRIDLRLENLSGIYGDSNPLLAKAGKRLFALNRGGKRIRGVLTYIGYAIGADLDLTEENIGRADALAEGMEMFQTAVLVHDDIIDNADTRRNATTLHRLYADEFGSRSAGDAMGICLGDLGINLACEHIARSYSDCPEVLSEYLKMVTDTIKGETLDVELALMEQHGTEPETTRTPTELVTDIHRLKSAAYTTIGPLTSGASLGGGTIMQISALRGIAEDMGIAFQIIDDLKDIYPMREQSGKPLGLDLAEYKQSMLYAYVRQFVPDAHKELRSYCGRDDLNADDIESVRELYRSTGAFGYVKDLARSRLDGAMDKLELSSGIFSERSQTLLEGFILKADKIFGFEDFV